MVPFFFSPVSFSLSSSVTATIPASTIGSSAMHLCPTSVIFPPQPSSLRAAPLSVQPLVLLEPASLSTPPRKLVNSLLCDCLARRDDAFAELDEALLACDDRTPRLKSSLAKSASDEANLYSEVCALQADLAARYVNLRASNRLLRRLPLSLTSCTPTIDV